MRPTYVGHDLAALNEPHPAPDDSAESGLGGWTAQVRAGRLEIDGDGSAGDWWRLAAVAGWRHLDETGTVVDVEGLQPPSVG